MPAVKILISQSKVKVKLCSTVKTINGVFLLQNCYPKTNHIS